MKNTGSEKCVDRMEESIREFDSEKFEQEFEKFLQKWFGESNEQKKAC